MKLNMARVAKTISAQACVAFVAITLSGVSASSQETHTVQKGETLIRLARKYNLTPDQLKKFNGITNSNHIFVGQVLRVTDPALTQQSNPSNQQQPGPTGNNQPPAQTATTLPNAVPVIAGTAAALAGAAAILNANQNDTPPSPQ